MQQFTWLAISARSAHTCAIASNNQAYCWGYNYGGSLGNNSTVNSNIPVAVDTAGTLNGKTIKSISSGSNHTCAIASDDLAYCWGRNNYGQLGNSSTTDSYVSVAVSTSGVLSGKTIKSIVAGSSHTCAIASDDNAYCWGYNTTGNLGNNSTTNSSIPVVVSTSGVLSGKTIKSIAVGHYHTCVVASNDNAYCWGWNNHLQLGNGTSVGSRNVPVAVDTTGVLNGKTVKMIALGDYHGCAIASDDQTYCWGDNQQYGQLGNNNVSITMSNTPVAVYTAGVLNGKTVKFISSTYNHTCVVVSDDKAYCWGWNPNGQLGNNSTTNSVAAVAVDTSGILSGKTIKSITAGQLHTCALDYYNKIYCWGNSDYGQLGNSSNTQSLVPVAIANPF